MLEWRWGRAAFGATQRRHGGTGSPQKAPQRRPGAAEGFSPLTSCVHFTTWVCGWSMVISKPARGRRCGHQTAGRAPCPQTSPLPPSSPSPAWSRKNRAAQRPLLLLWGLRAAQRLQRLKDLSGNETAMKCFKNSRTKPLQQLGGRRRQWHLLRGISVTPKAKGKQAVPFEAACSTRVTAPPSSLWFPIQFVLYGLKAKKHPRKKNASAPCAQQSPVLSGQNIPEYSGCTTRWLWNGAELRLGLHARPKAQQGGTMAQIK